MPVWLGARISREIRPWATKLSRNTQVFGSKMCQTRATGTFKRQKCARLEPQPLRKARNAPDSSHSHFGKPEKHQTRAIAASESQKCTRLEPQQVRNSRNAPDSSRRHFAKTDLRQTRATGTAQRQKYAGLKQFQAISSHSKSFQVIPRQFKRFQSMSSHFIPVQAIPSNAKSFPHLSKPLQAIANHFNTMSSQFQFKTFQTI